MSDLQQPLLDIRNLSKTYREGPWWGQKSCIRALGDVNLALPPNSIVALVGQSGSGKTTLAMCLVGLEEPDAGQILFEGRNLVETAHKASNPRPIQMIFQDSAGALSPRMSAVQIVEEPLLIRKCASSKDRRQSALEAMEQVGLSPRWEQRRPHELSGGQRQRLAIARALVSKPRILILDEPFAGLDLSIQGQIVNLLLDLQSANHLTYLLISHDLELVSCIADEVAVLYQGRIVSRQQRKDILPSDSERHDLNNSVLVARASV